ncbi:MAG: hypothetical protein EXS08_10820 [Planctomycetes bacterium]|nr:hypothetical protein [Planctomycetota bacterium]
MAVGVIWLLLGLFYWAAILIGAWVVFVGAPKGSRALREAAYFGTVGLTIASTALVPAIGVWVWLPVLFVAAYPFLALKELLN